MASRRLIALLLSSFITSTVAFQDVEEFPETYCITYLSTYLVPVSGITASPSSEASSVIFSPIKELTFTSTSKEPEASDLEPVQPSLSTSAGDVFLTTSISSSFETSAPGPGRRSVIFRIVPDSDTKRSLYNRAIGGFVGSRSDLCDDAAVFSLNGGRLVDGASPIYYNGEDYKELRAQAGPIPRGSVTTTFVDEGGYLQFVNALLPGGHAGFCQVSSSGRVYLTFGSSPSDCIPIKLATIGVEECLDEGSTSNAISTRTRTDEIVSEFTESFVIPTQTPSIPIDDPVTEDLPPTKPFETISVRFSNTSTASMNFPVPPTQSSTLSFLPIDTTSERFTISTSDSPVFPPEDTSTTIALPEDSTSNSGPSITDTSTVAASEAETTTLAETSTMEDTRTFSESRTPDVSATSTGTTIDTITTITSSESDTTIAETITTLDTSATADTTTTEPTTTTESELVFRRSCQRVVDGIDLWPDETFVDDDYRPIDSPFDIGFYGDFGKDIFVSTNGVVTVKGDVNAASAVNVPLPARDMAQLAVFPYWDDMYIDREEGHQITYQVAGVPGGRVLTIDWCVGGDQGRNHFTVSFFEDYKGYTRAQFYTISGGGQSATVGVQNLDLNYYEQVSYNSPDSVSGGTGLDIITGDDGSAFIVPYNLDS